MEHSVEFLSIRETLCALPYALCDLVQSPAINGCLGPGVIRAFLKQNAEIGQIAFRQLFGLKIRIGRQGSDPVN